MDVAPSSKPLDQPQQQHDPLEDSDFEVVSHINTLFPTEQSLATLSATIANVESEISTIDTNIRNSVRSQTTTTINGHGTGCGGSAAGGILTLYRAQASVETLVAKILDMKGRAEQSETIVRDMTRDIRQLDTAKRNLTSAITTLNHLNMVVGGVDKLTHLVSKKQYADVANLLQGVGKIAEHFQAYNNIPQLNKLSGTVQEIKKGLGEQLSLEFREAFTTSSSSSGGGGPAPSLNSKLITEGCAVLDVLDPSIKTEFLNWFISAQLKEYSVLFDENEDVAWLDKIDKRYAWLKKHLIQFEERYGTIFPSHWELSARIAIEFCLRTKAELTRIMRKRASEIDVKLLLSAIQKTGSFENLLHVRFGGSVGSGLIDDVSGPGAPAAGDVKSGAAGGGNKFSRIITCCFDPFLYIYIESQDKNIVELLDKFVADLRLHGFPTPATTSQQQQQGGASSSTMSTSSDASAVVLSNCADLFVFYKKCLVQCTQLSCDEPLLNLGLVFSKRLRDYCTRILQANLPKIGTSTATTGGGAAAALSSVSSLTRELRDNLGNVSLMSNFSSFLKDGEILRLSRLELYRITCILTTAEYCVETTTQLQDKLKEKLAGPDLIAKFSMEDEKKLFLNVIDGAVSLLVTDLLSATEPALATIPKTNWTNIESVGDASPFISAIGSQWKITIPTMREFLSTSRKYFVLLCQQFAKLFMSKYISTLYKCKNISKLGAQQLLLDTQSLKSLLLDLPSIGLTVKRKPPDKYSKIIVKELGRTEMILKIVMSPVEQVGSFVEHTCRLINDCDLSEFVKILDMKGYKRADQGMLTEEFKHRAPSLVGTGPGAGAGGIGSTAEEPSSSMESSRIRKLEKLLKKRIP